MQKEKINLEDGNAVSDNEMNVSDNQLNDAWCVDSTESGIQKVMSSLPTLKPLYEEVDDGGPACDTDYVNNPPHYTQGKIECIDAMESAFGTQAVIDFCRCNAFKYIWRAAYKNGIEDLNKAVWYINKIKEIARRG